MNCFCFFLEHHAFFDKVFFDKCGGQLLVELVRRVGMFLGRPPFWSGASGLQASLVRENQDGVSHQNT
jgi:hypothetical protein